MEDINITNVEFGSGLPKWATDESLNKLKHLLERQHNISDKERKKIVQLLGRLYQNDSKQLSNDRSIIQELRNIKNLVGKSSNDSNKKPTKDLIDSNKRIEGLLRNTNKLLKDISNNSGSAISSSKVSKEEKGAIVIDSKNIINAINRSADKIVSAIKSTKITLDVESKDNNKSPTSSEQDKNFQNLRETIERSTEDQIKAYRSLYTRQMRINNVMRTQSTMSGNTTRNARIDRVMQATRPTTTRRGSGVSPRTTSNISRTVRVLGRALGMVTRLVKFIPVIGQIVTVLTSVVALVSAAANSIKEFGWTLQEEYRAMLKSGFSFVNEIRDGIQMDGIALRRRINEAGLTYEQGIEIMEKNATLFNNLGIEGVFGTISELADLQLETGRTFQDELMLSRDEISKFTSQYLASSLNIVRTERQTAEERRDAARHFIEDARRFGQITGQGMQVIIDRMSELRQTDRYRLAVMGRSETFRTNLDTALTAFTSLNISGDMSAMFQEALLDSRGLGMAAVEGGQQLINTLGSVAGHEVAQELNNMVIGMQTGQMSGEDFNANFTSFIERLQTDNINLNQEQIDIIRASNDPMLQRIAGLLVGVQQAQNTTNDQRGTGSEESSDVAEAAQNLNSAQQRLRATAELVEAEMWDSGAGRNTLRAGLDLMTSGADAATTTVGLLGSILTGLFQVGNWILETLRNVISSITNMGRRIVRALSWFGGNDEYTQEATEQANTMVESGQRDREQNSTAVAALGAILGEHNIIEYNGIISRRNNARNVGSEFKDRVTDLANRAINGDTEAADHIRAIMDSNTSRLLRDNMNEILRTSAADGNLDLDSLNTVIEARRNNTSRDRQESENAARSEAQGSNTITQSEAGIQRLENDLRRSQGLEPTENTVSSSRSELNTTVRPSTLQNTTRGIATEQQQRDEDNRRVREERNRAERERQESLSEPRQTAQEETATTPQPVVVQSDNRDILAVLNRLNNNIEEMVRLQRNFNNDLTIEIIRS